MRRAAIGDEQIIDGVEGDGRAQQTFDLVQKIRGNVRRYPDGWGEAAPLTGLLYCADCGGKMYVHRTNNGKRISQYTCSQYIKVPCGTLCKTQHRINEDVVLSLVSEMLKAIAEYAKYDRAELTAEISALEKAIKSYETHEKDADRFIALIDKYENFDKLTIAMLNEFIEKILVHERDRKGRLHQNYLKRKASGAQKRYEDKIKERKKAEIEAEKATIRAEDIAKGVFVPVSSLPQREPMKGVQTA